MLKSGLYKRSGNLRSKPIHFIQKTTLGSNLRFWYSIQKQYGRAKREPSLSLRGTNVLNSLVISGIISQRTSGGTNFKWLLRFKWHIRLRKAVCVCGSTKTKREIFTTCAAPLCSHVAYTTANIKSFTMEILSYPHIIGKIRVCAVKVRFFGFFMCFSFDTVKMFLYVWNSWSVGRHNRMDGWKINWLSDAVSKEKFFGKERRLINT